MVLVGSVADAGLGREGEDEEEEEDGTREPPMRRANSAA